MLTLLSVVTSLAVAAAAAERPALVVEGTQPPAHITRAVVLTPGEGPPVVLYAAVSLTDQRLEQFTVMAFVFRADRSLKARQVAPGRHILEPRETKSSTLVVDGVPLDSTDVVVNRHQPDAERRLRELVARRAAAGGRSGGRREEGLNGGHPCFWMTRGTRSHP